jgi:hypothetical protein
MHTDLIIRDDANVVGPNLYKSVMYLSTDSFGACSRAQKDVALDHLSDCFSENRFRNSANSEVVVVVVAGWSEFNQSPASSVSINEKRSIWADSVRPLSLA